MAPAIPENDPLAQKIALLASRQRPPPLPPVLAPGVTLNPDSIYSCAPDIRLFGFLGTKNYHRAVAVRVSQMLGVGSAIINRPLTQDELDFYVETTSETTSDSRGSFLLGLELGAPTGFLWAQRSAEFKKYAPPIDASSKTLGLFKRYFETLKIMRDTDKAVYRRTLLKPVKVMAVAGFVCWAFGTLWSRGQTLWKLKHDPRMKQHNAEFANTDDQAAEKRRRLALIDHARMLQDKLGFTFSQEDTHENGFEESPSTTPSNQADTYASPSTRPESYTSSASNDQNMPAWPSSTSQTYPYHAPAANTGKESSFFDDDASPIAPDHKDTNAASGGSAWERIRRQNAIQSQNPSPYQSASPYPSQPRYEQAQPTADSGSDANRERERAQAEFDRMLEAERRQQNDSDGGSSASRGWWK
ncbi:hypothetical protein BDW74DRAFT_120773 [Aspergillus multicolor]|uniref:putative endo-1,3(4)-beta-glucanase n=1 Tax=Aspergillus multicolor TaxID=41759 RepID=UPI003CCE345B